MRCGKKSRVVWMHAKCTASGIWKSAGAVCSSGFLVGNLNAFLQVRGNTQFHASTLPQVRGGPGVSTLTLPYKPHTLAAGTREAPACC